MSADTEHDARIRADERAKVLAAVLSAHRIYWTGDNAGEDSFAEWVAKPGNLPDGDTALRDLLAREREAGRQERSAGEWRDLDHAYAQGAREALTSVAAAYRGEALASLVDAPKTDGMCQEFGIESRADSLPRRPNHLKWNGHEWVDCRCGCRYHPDDDNGTHGGGPHVHACDAHRPTPPAEPEGVAGERTGPPPGYELERHLRYGWDWTRHNGWWPNEQSAVEDSWRDHDSITAPFRERAERAEADYEQCATELEAMEQRLIVEQTAHDVDIRLWRDQCSAIMDAGEKREGELRTRAEAAERAGAIMADSCAAVIAERDAARALLRSACQILEQAHHFDNGEHHELHMWWLAEASR